ncbi:hypothetical protein NX059_004207 [Plenodomus lindquistii]|nr:hypothetical protein NX059_004207 [Plenodomus lindquistii]
MSPSRRSSSLAASECSPLPSSNSPSALRSNLDQILDGLTSSPSTSSTPTTLSSPLPPSRANEDVTTAEDIEAERYSSEDGREDEIQYGEVQYDFDDETRDGYEDEDQSMTLSDEDMNTTEKENRHEGEKAVNTSTKDSVVRKAVATPPRLTLTNVYVHPHSVSPGKKSTHTQDMIKGNTMEDVLNTSYMTGRTTSYQWTSGVYVGNGLVTTDEQLRRNSLRARINKELTEKWEQQQLLPQAPAEQDRYDSDTTPESEPLGNYQSSFPSDQNENGERAAVSTRQKSELHSEDSSTGKTSHKYKPSMISATPAPRTGNKKRLSLSPTKHQRKASSTDSLEKIVHEVLFDNLDPEERAELEELDKYRDDDLAPLADTIAYNDDGFGLVDCGTPVKDAYKLYLRERSRSIRGEESVADANIGEEREEEVEGEHLKTILLPEPDTSLAAFSPQSTLGDISKPDPNPLLRKVAHDGDYEEESSVNHVALIGRSRAQYAGYVFSTVFRSIVTLLLVLFVAHCVQFVAWMMSVYREGPGRRELWV